MDVAGKFQQAIADQAGKGLAEVGDVLVKFAARLDDELGGGGRSRSADIGDEISDGEIGFVADAGNDGNF